MNLVRMRTLSAVLGISLLGGAVAWAADDAAAAAERAAAAARAGTARTGEYKPSVKIPEYDKERVRALAAQGTKRGAAEYERLKRQGPLADAARKHGPAEEAGPQRKPVPGRVVVALSSSVPEAMLASYMQQLDGHPESLVVLRGFIGGAHTVGPTGILLERVMRKTAAKNGPHVRVESVVDPMFYAQLGIDKVPAVIYLPGVQALAHCDEEDYSKAAVVYGAVSIEAALKEVAKLGVNVPPSVISHYRGSGWERKQ